MYTQQETQNVRHSRENGNPVGWMPAYAGMTANISMTKSTEIKANISLKTLSNEQLLSQTKNLVQKERNINIQVLQHLQEIEKRKLYLERGFSSLFEYTVKELGYSHSAAYRRIKAMRLCRDIPQATSKIKTGNLNLTTASQLQTFFEKKKRKDKKQILDKATNLEKCDVRFTAAPAAGCVNGNADKDEKKESKPENKTPVDLNSTQKLNLIKKAEGQSSRELEKTLFDIDPEVCNEKERVRHINNDKVEIKVILDKNSQQKLEDLKKLLSHKNPNMSYGELFSLLAELGLNKYDPKRKLNKKIDWIPAYAGMTTSISKRTTSMESEKTVDKKPQKTSGQKTNQKLNNNHRYSKPTRYIPSVIRHHVWMRDQGQCTYVCPKTKRRCASNHLVQIDHVKLFSLGGTHETDNLRLLCANHNQYAFSQYQKYKRNNSSKCFTNQL